MYKLSIVVVYYDKDIKYMEDLVKSLPRWAEWVLVKSVKDGTDTAVRREKNLVKTTYNYTGEFNFMHSKNYAKQFASGEWILYLDDDEHLDILQHDYIKKLLDNISEDIGGVYCTQYSWLKGLVTENVGQRSATATVRLARNIPPIKWQYHIHDLLELSITDSGYLLADSNIRILHDGWAIGKKELAERLERNLKSIWRHPELIDLAYDRYSKYLTETATTLTQLKGK